MADLTLCLIARDEEAMLPGCLASAEGAVDRMVVVDTGSEDRTPEIARSFGAEVVDHPWNDDFAAARNAGLAAISSGWVLVLDADERLAENAPAALRAAIADARPDLGLLPLHHASRTDAEPAAVLSGEARLGEPQLLPRLLRWTPDLRYEGIIHESVATWAARQRKLVSVDAPIVHFGAVPERRRLLAKLQRNLRLLERRCLEAPDDPTARSYFAAELRRAGLLPRALDEARAAVTALRRARRRGARHLDAVLPLTIALELLIRTGELEEAEKLLRGTRRWAEHPNLAFYAGVVAESRYVIHGSAPERLAEAERHYRAAEAFGTRLFAAEVVPGAASWGAALRLGTVQLLAGRSEEAVRSFERALAHQPPPREAELGWVEAKLAVGDLEAALRRLESLLAAPDADAWLLAAQAANATGAVADALLFLERAGEARALRPFVARHREEQYVVLERAFRQRPRRVFAWPRWEDEALTRLLTEYGSLLANRDATVLCLRLDPKLDGPPAEAIAHFESAYAKTLEPGAALEVIVLDDENASGLGPSAAGDLALDLPGSDEEPRRGFLAHLGARRIATPEELARALADGSGEAPPAAGPVS